MKRLVVRSVLVATAFGLLVGGFTPPVWAQEEEEPLKVAYVLMERVFEEYVVFAETTAKINVEIGPKEEAIQVKLDEFTLKMDEMIVELSNPMLTDEARAEISMQYNQLMEEAFLYRDDELYKLDLWRQEQYQPVYDDIYEEIQRMAEENEYDLVLNQSTSLLFGEQEFDITSDLIESLNAKAGAGQ